MRRRKLLIGLGALSAGGSAAFGTEAFTSAQAERNADVAVAGDQSSFIAIQPLDSSNADKYVETDDSTVGLELDGDGGGAGAGVASNAVTQIEDLFRVVNQGSQTTFVYFEDDSDAVTFRVTRSTDTETTGSNGQSLEGSSNSVELDVGEQVVVGLTVNTMNSEVGDTLLDSVTLRAESEGSSNAPTNSIAQPQYVVDSDAFGDSDNDADSNDENIFPSISEAVSAAESGAVIGVRNTQDITSRIIINKSLTLSGFDKPSVGVDVDQEGGEDEVIYIDSDDVTIQNLDFTYGDIGREPTDVHLISGAQPRDLSGLTIRGLDITSNASFDTNAIDVRGVDIEIVNNTVTDAGIQVQHGSGSSSGGSVTISGNSVTESGSGGGILGEGITAFGVSSTSADLADISYTIEDNLVSDTGNPAIKLTDNASGSTPADVNGESDKQDQIEALLRDNDVFSARIEGSNGAQVTSGSTFSTIQSAVDNAEAGGEGDGVALVDSGTFSESVSIKSGVSLRGPNAGTPGQDSARGEEATIVGPTDAPAVKLDSDEAEIDGFRVEGGGSSGDVIDIPESGTGNTVRVKNNIIRASESASGSGFINGIEVVNSDPDDGVGKPASAIIKRNDIKIDTGTKGAAINVLSGPIDHSSITVENNELRGDIGGYRDIDSLTVKDNLIAPAGDAAPNSAMDVSGVDGATFTDNTFRGDVGDLAYDDDSNSKSNGNTPAATASSVLNNNDGNSGNTFEPAAETATAADNDDVIEFTSN